MKGWLNAVHEWLWDRKYNLFEYLFSLCPIQKNKIVIVSYYGADYGDNGKYIVEELKKQNENVDVVWLLKEQLMQAHHLPQGVRPVIYRSIRSVYELETAAVWIDNARKVYGRKRKGQLYIQTWHGGPGVKRVEMDVAEELGQRYVRNAKRDSKMCDVILSNSQFMTELFSRAFWYDGEILACGTPRNDVLCNCPPQIRKKIRSFYGIPEKKNIVLYAPTFRKDKDLSVYDMDLKRCCQWMEERFGGEFVLYLRLHPNISHLASQMEMDPERVVDATLYPDMQELLAGSDCMITDYSSSTVDYSLTGRPCFLYASDIEKYRGNRGYYFGFDEMPCDIAQNNEQLHDIIMAYDEKCAAQRISQFHKKFGMWEKGTACAACAERILDHIKNAESQAR